MGSVPETPQATLRRQAREQAARYRAARPKRDHGHLADQVRERIADCQRRGLL